MVCLAPHPKREDQQPVIDTLFLRRASDNLLDTLQEPSKAEASVIVSLTPLGPSPMLVIEGDEAVDLVVHGHGFGSMTDVIDI